MNLGMRGKNMSVHQILTEAKRYATAGNRPRAAELFRAVLAREPGNRVALQGLAALGGTGQNPLETLAGLYRQQRYREAIAAGRALAPRLPSAVVIPIVIGSAHVRLGEKRQAAECFAQALKIEPRNLQARFNLAIVQRDQGQLDAATENLAAVIEAKPDHAEAHSALGTMALRLGRLHQAEASLSRAVALAPRDVAALVGLGNLHDRLGRSEEAIACYRAALELNPDHTAAHMNLCEVYEKTNRIVDFAQAVGAAEARLPPDDPQLRLRRGQLAFRENRLEEARDLLEAVDAEALTGVLSQRHANLLGRIHDRLGDHARAFEWFKRMNRHATEAARGSDGTRYLAEIEALASAWSQAPTVDTNAPDPNAPAFVVGFPRSGTTLLDTILRGHPGLCVIEEGPMVGRMREILGALPQPDILSDIAAETLTEMRVGFQDELARHPDFTPDRRVIDKLPLNIKDAALIERVFPGARFILTLRHPCDAVLSCFMQNFALNDAMANFLDLTTAARLYDALMRLWTSFETACGLHVHVLKYEDLVADLPGTVGPLMAYLDLDWHDGLADYRKTALARGRINTPSYHQVTEPLYRRASGRWQNYRDQLAPILPLLEPWAERFGYET